MANTYLTRTPSSAGNRKTFTISTWVKLSKIQTSGAIFSARSGSPWGVLDFSSGDGVASAHSLHFGVTAGVSPGVYTTRIFRDASAWYHIVVAVDTTQATASNRVKIYINGVQETLISGNYPTLNQDTQFNSTISHDIGASASSNYFDGSMSHFHFIDGTAYDATAFGEYDANGVWKIKTSPSVTYGTNGFFILKDGNSVTDQSPNTNNFTVGGGNLTNTEDNPSNVFATLNPLIKMYYQPSFSDGNLTFSGAIGNWRASYSTIGASSGKWYAEIKTTSGSNNFTGICTADTADDAYSASDNYPGKTSEGWGIYSGGTLNNNDTTVGGWSGTSYTTNDIIGVAVDLDNNFLYFRKNAESWMNSGNPTSGATGTGGVNISSISGKFVLFGASVQNSTVSFNFGNGYFGTTPVASAGTNASGNGIFEHDVPTGYTALSTKGLNL